ncbi:alpha/beta hydrolase family esterase [Jongsikchunia kroppenstedtii]|uniref:alpha/beta hydrolase family esterase n=1 Tax=Jongsikchunia kroppenstedtii TaxID=1121721 RepID=UPI0003AA6C26|nr:alpha/beta fold hydrolase [Jongsikchunia kroppenstedtii]
MRSRLLVLVLTITCLAAAGWGSASAAPPPTASTPGQISTSTLTNAVGTRSFQTYVPRNWAPGRPLIVWLHGASAVPRGDYHGLRRSSTLLTEADRQGFAVVAPMQSLAIDHGTWQILNPANVVRGQGESSIVADIVRRSSRELHVDPARVYVVGHSAGGAMAQDVAALYPELFAGMAAIAGVPFMADPTGAAIRVARHGAPLPTFLVQGDRDSVTPPVLGQVALSAALGANGIAGARPWSTRLVPADGADRYSTDIQRYGHGRSEVVYATVLGADHPTGPGGVTINGPTLDRAVIGFLLAHRRG